MDKHNLYEQIMSTKSSVPIGQSGEWKVEKFLVSEKEASFDQMRNAIHGSDRGVVAGGYTKLTHKGNIIMSDTPAEINDHMYFVHKAMGNVLVNGLGLGMVVEALMLKPEVKHVTVIEIAPEVIQLVGDYLLQKHKDRLTIIHGNALTWTPPPGRKVYDAVWHDIWPTICGDHYDSMKKLHRKYAQKAVYQDSWCRYEIQQAAKQWC